MRLPLLEIIAMAWNGLWTNKVRSFLTTLGIIIGVGSVVLLTSIGTGLQAYVTEQFASLGSDTIFVSPGNPFGEGGGFGNQEQVVLENFQPTLKRRYLETILREHRDVIEDGIASAVGLAEAKYDTTTKKVTMYGVMPAYRTVNNSEAEVGEWFTEPQERRSARVAMLGSNIAKELFGEVDPVGKTIRLDAQSYRVLGVLETKASFGGPNFDNYVYLPLQTLQDNFEVDIIDSFIFEALSSDTVTPAKKAIENTLLRYLEEDEFTVFDQTQLLDTINEILGVLTLGLGGIAAISLVVGGIGIMNIMLVSVTERTREIGLRKALGATPEIIMLQFLIEAAILSIIGGIIGLAIAYGGTLVIQSYFPARVTWVGVSLALGVSTGVGLVFGAAPAYKAAKLSPIEALRYE